MKEKLVLLMLLSLCFCVYAASMIFNKLSSGQEFFSPRFYYYLILSCVMLGTYAILWQKVLARMPLNKAFLCKSVTILMILAVSALFFSEAITINNVVGSGFIISGLGILAWKE